MGHHRLHHLVPHSAVSASVPVLKPAHPSPAACPQDAFPSHQFIGEEGSAEQGFASELTDEPTWMCDPLVSG